MSSTRSSPRARRTPPAPGAATGSNSRSITHADHARLGGDLAQLRRQGIAFDPKQARTWTADISKFEHCTGKVRREIDDHPIFVYTPEMIVIEKLRALCQQLPAYPHRGRSTPRARDFYDIHEVLQELILPADLKTSKSIALARGIFAIKQVPLTLLPQLQGTRDFHAPDWPSVSQSIVGRRDPFDVYFDFVIRLVEELEQVWMV